MDQKGIRGHPGRDRGFYGPSNGRSDGIGNRHRRRLDDLITGAQGNHDFLHNRR
jgi:hypothetical protein